MKLVTDIFSFVRERSPRWTLRLREIAAPIPKFRFAKPLQERNNS
jgi:hypothetical protein